MGLSGQHLQVLTEPGRGDPQAPGVGAIARGYAMIGEHETVGMLAAAESTADAPPDNPCRPSRQSAHLAGPDLTALAPTMTG